MHFPDSSAFIDLPEPDPSRHYLVYLHIPYCAVLCPFCSFHRVKFEHNSASSYFSALRQEIGLVTDAGFSFNELYIGGGTPTLLPGELTKTIQFLRNRHPVTRISSETNPDNLQLERLHELRDAGINRLSVGVQSFDDNLLEEMQRLQPYGDGEAIAERLRKAEGIFDTLNVDMIFNFPHQTESSLRRALAILTDEVGVDQVSFYPLMSLDSTRQRLVQAMGSVDHSRERQLYELVVEHMLSHGYSRSSAWCFSKQAGMIDEYVVEQEQYVGLGSGSFSFLQGGLYASTFSIEHYRSMVEAGSTGTFGFLRLSEVDQMRYYLLMKLFSGTLDKARAEDTFGGRFQRTTWLELALLRAAGAIENAGSEFVLTEDGYYLWVMMMREFFTGVNNLRDQMRLRIPVETSADP
jgi:coproporphyrinogen III oxidase-like Fe-S oxidoreductase